MTTTIQHPTRRYYTDGHRGHDDAVMLISLPAVPGVSMAPDRTETTPTLPTIRAAHTPAQPADNAAITRRRIDALAATICAARSGLPAVTVAMEGL